MTEFQRNVCYIRAIFLLRIPHFEDLWGRAVVAFYATPGDIADF